MCNIFINVTFLSSCHSNSYAVVSTLTRGEISITISHFHTSVTYFVVNDMHKRQC